MTGQDTKTNPMQDIRDYEANCNGTDQVYRHGLMRRFVFTDGVKFVADTAQAYWLIDAILSHQLNARKIALCNGFQVWKLTKNKKGSGCKLTCDDGGQDGPAKVVITQRIEFTDFPLPAGEEIVFYIENDVLMLRAER